MKLCVCGKGGSGKSTIVTLLAFELNRRDKKVVVIDSDESNAGLYRMLGMKHPPHPLIELAGGKKNVMPMMRKESVASAKPEEQALVLMQPEIRVADLPTEFVVCKEGCCLVVVGKIHQSLEGCACPMGVLTREFLKRLRLNTDEIAIVDMEAGVEHFGRGIETSANAVMAVVEPSLESISLSERIKELATSAGAQFAGVVVNKVASAEIERQVASELERRDMGVLGVIRHHQEVADVALLGRTLGGLKHEDGPSCAEEIMTIVDALRVFGNFEQPAIALRDT